MRRIALLLLLGVAVVAYAYVPDAVLHVVMENPADWYEQAYAPHATIGATRLAESVLRGERPMLPIAVFLERHLQGRVKDVSGAEWEEVGRCLTTADATLGSVASGCYYQPDAAPISELLAWMADAQATRDPAVAATSGGKFIYLRWSSDTLPLVAGLMMLDPTDYGWDSVPLALRQPFSGYARYFVLSALLVYVVLPRPRKLAPDALVFSRASVVPADVVGAGLTILFFALPILIVADRGKLSSLLDFGFGPATLVFWLLSGLSSFILLIAAGQAVRQVVLSTEGLRDVTWRRDVTVRFEEIKSIHPTVREFPSGLRRMLWIAGLMLRSPLLISQLLLFGNAKTLGLTLDLRDGTQLRIVAPPGLDRVLEHCQTASIPIVDE
jgi:hypothetical protein